MERSPYDPEVAAVAFDAYGELEWSRHEVDPAARASFHLHCELLRRYLRADDRVLDVGAGAGRFTVELARLGARVTVGDVSEGQLELNRRHVEKAGYASAVDAWERMDIVDLSRFPDEAFDATVCFGGPLSLALEEHERAFAELLRVTRRSGFLLASVMSLAGAARMFLPAVVREVRDLGPDAADVLRTGYLPAAQSSLGAPMHMFRWAEVEAMIARHPCELVEASAANFLTAQHHEFLEGLIADDPQMWERVLAWESELAAFAGALDGGTHIVFVVRRT